MIFLEVRLRYALSILFAAPIFWHATQDLNGFGAGLLAFTLIAMACNEWLGLLGTAALAWCFGLLGLLPLSLAVASLLLEWIVGGYARAYRLGKILVPPRLVRLVYFLLALAMIEWSDHLLREARVDKWVSITLYSVASAWIMTEFVPLLKIAFLHKPPQAVRK
jgi:hypothetical protein